MIDPKAGFSRFLNPAVLLDHLRSVLRLIKSPFDSIAFHFFRAVLPTLAAPPRQILLLVRIDGIGDLLYCSRYLASIRRAFPGFRLTLVCQKQVAGLAAELQGFDEIVPVDADLYQWNYFFRLAFLRSIRELRPHTAVYMSYHRRHIGDEMTLLSGAQRTVAFSGNNEIIRQKTRLRNNRYYSDVVETPDHVPEDAKYRTLLRRLNVATIEPLSDIWRSDRKATRRSEVAVFAPGSTSSMRQWPPDRFAAAADALADRHGLRIILCGDRSQAGLLSAVGRRMKSPFRAISDSSLPDITELIRSAAIFIGNDSGLLHIAAVTNTPSVGIVGGGHFSRYFPYGNMEIVSHSLPCFECNWKCRFRRAFCISEIAADDVIAAAGRVLSGSAGARVL